MLYIVFSLRTDSFMKVNHNLTVSQKTGDNLKTGKLVYVCFGFPKDTPFLSNFCLKFTVRILKSTTFRPDFTSKLVHV